MLLFGPEPGAAGGTDALCRDCLRKMAQGDTDALGTLYEHTKGAVYGFALSMTRNAQEAEDILQDTFVSLYASAGSYREMGKPMAWILTLARNLALMKLRERRRAADWPAAEPFPEDAPRSDDRLILEAALKTLGPEEGQIVMLHAVAGLKHREIAQVLQKPLSTILSKYNRALKKLRTALEEER